MSDFLRLYGERDAAALLIAEYEGEPIAALIAATLWPGGDLYVRRLVQPAPQPHAQPSAPVDRDPLGEAHACTLYDFRAIAEVLEPNEDMYSLYTYKQGFGGDSFLALETHDPPYSAPLYWLYRRTLKLKRDRDRRKHEAELHARERASTEKAASAAKPATGTAPTE